MELALTLLDDDCPLDGSVVGSRVSLIQSSPKRRFGRQFDQTLKPMLKTGGNLIKNATELVLKISLKPVLKPLFSAKHQLF